MALSSTIVWEIRSGGADTNGGGFKTGASGTDFTQQNAAQFALTGVTTSGAGATFLTASAAATMVGNVAQVISGTNFTAGFYEITSVVAGVSVTCDANVSTGVGANGVINIGGALATIGKIGTNSANQGAVAGNYIWVKGTFSLSATDTFAAPGTTTSPIVIRGYGTTRGDGYQGRTNGNGPLITTNMPTLTYASTFRLNVTGNYVIVDCLNVSGAISSQLLRNNGSGGLIVNCKSVNSQSNASATAYATTNCIINCDGECTGGTSSSAVVTSSGAYTIVGGRFKVASTAAAVSMASGGTIIQATVYASGGVGVSSGDRLFALNNTIAGCTGDGIDISAGITALNLVMGNMITDNGGYGLDMNNAAGVILFAFNRTRDNTSGATNLATDWIAATNWGNVTTDTGGASTDYVNAGTDYNLIAGSPGTSASLPQYASMGALQRSQTGGGGGVIGSLIQSPLTT